MLKENRKKYHHGDLKPALVQAGLELLEEVGLEDLSLRAIAARVGVSHTAPKNHFESLKGLLCAIAAEGFRRHAEEMRKGVEGTSPGKDRLRAATAGYVRFARENPELFRLMFSSGLARDETPELAEAGAESYSVLQSVAAGLDWPRPALRPELHSWQTELLLWTIVHGYASLLIEGRGPRTPHGEPLLDVLEIMPDFEFDSNADRATQ
ncbi:MAG: TetR-like C-terminal domain-containing protein [Pseudomonadota bacterium]